MTKIITLHSYRGGTGKSNLVANIGTVLSLSGKRVGILDSDFQCPGQYILFGLEARQLQGKNLEDYFLKRNTLKDAIYDMTSVVFPEQKSLEKTKGKLFLIPSSDQAARINSSLQRSYDLNALNEAIRQISRALNLDYLIIDTHSNLDGETLLPIAIADTLLIVLRPDQQDYQATSVAIDVARRLDVPDIKLIVNMVLPIFDQDLIKSQVEAVMSCPVLEIVPFAVEMVALGNSGIFCLHYPDHSLTNALFKITNSLHRT
jgi:MinD-like ATPase involved in chromosome partitioning or flagellar assembly